MRKEVLDWASLKKIEGNMNFIRLNTDEDVGTIILNRPKVNALNEVLVDELDECFKNLADDSGVRAIVLTGEGSFFSFGLDVPEFMAYSKDSFTKFLVKFTDLLRYIYLFPKPVVAALNGHTIAGGGMLALACDYRIMASEKAKISLNELTFGSTVFTSSVQMLKSLIGGRSAELVLYTGAMYSADDAKKLGLVDESVARDSLSDAALSIAQDFAKKEQPAFRSMKTLLRKKVVEIIDREERDSVYEFVDIWYSEATWKNLERIKIRD